MSLIICTECKKEYSDKALACPNCGCPTDSRTVAKHDIRTPSVYDKTPREETIRYLSFAKELEQTIFTYKQTYKRIEQKIRQLGHYEDLYKPEKPFYDFPFWATFFISFAILLVLCCTIIEGRPLDVILIITILPLIFGSSYLLLDLGIAFGGALVISLIGLLVHIYIRKSAYSKAVKEYKKQLDEDKERVKKEKDIIKLLKNEQNILQNEINKTVLLLEKLYSLNLIFPKYRNMVAITTMLEYFESGRCDCLTGPHGAYDTYSYEEKQNIIIGKLDVVINMLNDIKNTQYLLYSAIQESNEIAGRIFSNTEKIIESSGVIRENTALSAYNSEITKQNTAISAYIDIFSY